MQSLSLVLPIWNEESFIADVVHDIEKVLDENRVDYELLLVENGSTDRTLEVAKDLARQNPRCRVVIKPQGYGSASRGGLDEATKELVGYMPSDGQISEKVLVELLKKMESGSYHLVKINRVKRESWIRKINSQCFNFIAGSLFGLCVKDINGSPKIFPRKYVPVLSLKSDGDLIDTEFMAKAKYLGWNICEVATESAQRVAGDSHVNIPTVVRFCFELTQLRFSKELRDFKQRTAL